MFSLQFMISVFFICVVLCCEYVCSGESGQSCEKRRISCGPFEKPCNLAKPGTSPAENLRQSGTFHLVRLQSFLVFSRCTLLSHTEALRKIHPQVKRKWADLGRFGSMQADAGQIQEFSGDSTQSSGGLEHTLTALSLLLTRCRATMLSGYLEGQTSLSVRNFYSLFSHAQAQQLPKVGISAKHFQDGSSGKSYPEMSKLRL
jgi:hypothetical protein